MIFAIAFLFFWSGVAALLYEIVWTREIGYVLGASSTAVAAVVAAYLSGLALGAWLAGRWSLGRKRGLVTYAGLEVCIALTAPWVPDLLRALDQRVLDPVWDQLAGAGLATATRFAGAFLVLLVPTALMGATLPVLCNSVSRQVTSAGEAVGRLYGLNTLGGMLGCLLGGFWFIESLGLTASMWTTAALNLVLAASAVLLHHRLRRVPAASAASAGDSTPAPAEGEGGQEADEWRPSVALPRAALVLALLITSFVSIAAEILWTRLLALAIGGTTYSFSLVLATFLGGLGLGSCWVGRALRRRRLDPGTLGQAQLLAGLFILLTMSSYDDLVGFTGIHIFEAQRGLIGRACWSLVATAAVCLVPCFLFGVSFPLLTELWVRRRADLGQGVGAAYLASTAGGVSGSVVAGFVLAPTYGLEQGLAFVALVAVLTGALLLPLRPHRRVLAGFVGATGGALALLVFLRGGPLPGGAVERIGLRRLLAREPWEVNKVWGGVFLYGPQAVDPRRRPVVAYDGAACSVNVWTEGNQYSLSVNGKVDASGGRDMETQLMLAFLPQLLHPDPQHVFVLGYGSGVTAGAAATYGSRVLVAEIERGVLDASPYFADLNFGAHEHERVRVALDDGRSVLRRTDRRFDVITTEPSNPWMSGMSSLFTREFYELCRDRLAPGGLLCQWVQLYWSSVEDYRSIAATIRSVFPHAALFASSFHDTLLLASSDRIELDFEAWEERLAERPLVRRALRDHAGQFQDEPYGLAVMLSSKALLWGSDFDRFVSPATARVTDDRPFLEFSAARRMQSRSFEDIMRAVGEARQEGPYCAEGLAEKLSPAQHASVWARLAALEVTYGRPESAEALAARAAELEPDLPGLALLRFQVALLLGREDALGRRREELIRKDFSKLIEAAELCAEHGHADAGLGLLRLYRSQRGASAALLAAQGKLLERKGDRGAALQAFEEALLRDPDLPAAREGVGRLR